MEGKASNNKVAIITGGSDGIGKALCLKYGRAGYTIVFTGRDQNKIDAVSKKLKSKSIKHLGLKLDAASNQDNQTLIQETISAFGRLDVLICNAGISMRVLFEDIELEVFDKIMAINFSGPVSLIKHALKYITLTKGSIIGVSSINGRRATPARTAYAASKYAFEGFLESLRMELKPKDIHVMVVCPGFTQTNMRGSAIMPDGNEQGETKLNESKMMSAETVARKVYNSMIKKKRDLILTTQGKLAIGVGKFFPSFMDKMVFKVMSKKADSPFYKQSK
ncbi:MAG: SDR family oxidoreductase [Cyclobacteriaceae bacterium]